MLSLSRKTMLIGISSLIIVGITTSLLIVFLPDSLNSTNGWSGQGYIPNTVGSMNIDSTITNEFSTYTPYILNFTPCIQPQSIKSDLSNVNLQDLTINSEYYEYLSQNGFYLLNQGQKDIYYVYDSENYQYPQPKFITTDLCLHTYHVLYDISLRILEIIKFFDAFETMLLTLRDDQFNLNLTVTEPSVHEAINKNIAYLSVMLYLLNETNNIPTEVQTLTQNELNLINATSYNDSAIFEYKEDYTQYKVRGHYTKSEVLSNYFKAMMYAGRITFSIKDLGIRPGLGIDQTRMALLLLSSFNSTIDTSSVWNYWDSLYEPTKFYVGAADDLEPRDYYSIWSNFNFPTGDELASPSLISDIIEEIDKLPGPAIYSSYNPEQPKGLRLIGQRYTPDSDIFQSLVIDAYPYGMPSGLDVFSVFGSPRADYHTRDVNLTYPLYDDVIITLRNAFNSLNESEWVQNLYWNWLYVLFPLMSDSFEGYPGFMRSTKWADKALMTTMGSWAELRHDTILYAKQSYTPTSAYYPNEKYGYVEPYPYVYARLASLTRMMYDGLEARGLLFDDFKHKLEESIYCFERLAEISVKELQCQSIYVDLGFIDSVGDSLLDIATFDSDQYGFKDEEERTALIADVHSAGVVLEVGVGDPYTIYVVVQDFEGNLFLTRGATFSYYEFVSESRLTDEEWRDMLDADPPDPPEWIQESLELPLSLKMEFYLIEKQYL